MERRSFFTTVLAVGAGAAALMRGIKAKARGLPSDPGGGAKAAAGMEPLPPFEKNSDYTLERALENRKTDRDFDPDKSLTMDQVSKVLWAANGVNREDGHLTTPSAVARYPIEVYAALPCGVVRFDNKKHALEKISEEDIRSKVPSTQPGLKRSNMTLLYVVDKSKMTGLEDRWASLEIGCMVQNTYLMAAQLGLGCCVFALVRYNKVIELMGLKDNQELVIAQAVGVLK